MNSTSNQNVESPSQETGTKAKCPMFLGQADITLITAIGRDRAAQSNTFVILALAKH
jgi:hypothetical protein